MKHIGLFEGIGGFSLAARWMKWETVAWCEIDPFCQKVLKHHFPNANPHEDITKTDFTQYANRIDILTGGFPCQPYSGAGKRLGKEDPRHLWPQMLRSIREVRPRWIVGENVFGIVNWSEGLVFEEVCAQLENEGYEVQPFILPASAVEAPHERYRVWFVAKDTMRNGCVQREFSQEGSEVRKFGDSCAGSCDGIHKQTNVTTSPKCTRLERHRKSECACGAGGKRKSEYINEGNCDNYDADTRLLGQEKRKEQTTGIEQCGEIPDWSSWPTQYPLCSGNDGISERLDGITFPRWRKESLRSYGNAIVPQVAFQIFNAIQEYENIHNGTTKCSHE